MKCKLVVYQFNDRKIKEVIVHLTKVMNSQLWKLGFRIDCRLVIQTQINRSFNNDTKVIFTHLAFKQLVSI